MSREFWSKCARASAARNLNPAFIAMTEIQVKRLVNEAVLLHRDIAIRTERLKTLKADLVREARRHEHEFTPTENGGSRWTVTGNNGCIARVNFPAPALVSHIESEGETFEQILALSGECVRSPFRMGQLPATDSGVPRGSRCGFARRRSRQIDRALPDDILAAREL